MGIQETQRQAQNLKQDIEERAGIQLPTDPFLRGRSATVGCQSNTDAQKLLGIFPDDSAPWRCLWPSKKSVASIINVPAKKGISEVLCVFLLNVSIQDVDILQKEIELKAGITLPTKPCIPLDKTFAFVGCRERTDVLKVFEALPSQAR